MGEWVKVTAQDGHELGAYVATPEGKILDCNDAFVARPLSPP